MPEGRLRHLLRRAVLELHDVDPLTVPDPPTADPRGTIRPRRRSYLDLVAPLKLRFAHGDIMRQAAGARYRAVSGSRSVRSFVQEPADAGRCILNWLDPGPVARQEVASPDGLEDIGPVVDGLEPFSYLQSEPRAPTGSLHFQTLQLGPGPQATRHRHHGVPDEIPCHPTILDCAAARCERVHFSDGRTAGGV